MFRTSQYAPFQLLSDRGAALIAWLSIVRGNDLVKDRRPPKAAALRAVLDKIIAANKNAVQAIKAAFSSGEEIFGLRQ
jgi:hypothetical protein